MTIFAWNWDDADDSHYNGFTEVYIIYQKEKGREETLAERKLFPPLKTVHKSDVGCFNVSINNINIFPTEIWNPDP